MRLPPVAHDIQDVVDRLQRRAEGDPAALDAVWADESESWRSYSGQVNRMTARQRADLARRELAAFRRAMPDFRRASTFHWSPSTETVIELTAWSGTAKTGRIGVEISFIYTVRAGRIQRVDMYADSRQIEALSAALAASS